MTDICIIQKRQIWIFLSVPIHAHPRRIRTETNVWFHTVTIRVFRMNCTPEFSPFQFFIIRQFLIPLNKISVIHNIIYGNIGKIPVVIIVFCDCVFGILNAFPLTHFCVYFSFFSIFMHFPRLPRGRISRKIKLHKWSAQYVIVIKNKISSHQTSTDRSEFSSPTKSLRNDNIVFTIPSRYRTDLTTMITRQKQFRINRKIQIHSGRSHFFIFTNYFIGIIIKI